MIRPFTFVCALLAAGSGLYLYQTKHRAQLLDREIARTIKLTETVRERSGVLRAEWALLSEPDRLAELSRQHLGLKSLAPTQFVALGDLGAKLPAPLPPGSMMVPAEEPDVPMAAPVGAPIGAAGVAAAKPVQPAQVAAAAPAAASKPVQVASLPQAGGQVASVPRAAAKVAAAKPAEVVPLPAPAPAPVASVAQVHPAAPRPSVPVMTAAAAPIGGRPATAVASNTIGESVARVSRGLPPLAYHGDAPSAPIRISATPIGAPMAASAVAPVQSGGPIMGVVSSLGGARTALPAPVPYNASR